ncbi:MAG: hypothetical protein ACE5FI_18950, partial [Anaerolineales bacterium]
MFTPKADPVRRTLFAERNVRRLLIFAVFLGACAPAAGEAIPDTPVATAPVATATERAPTHTVMPSPTTPPSETATATSIPTSLPEPTVTMPFEFIPVLSVGATGDFSVIDGSLDVLGVVEVT